MCHYKYNERLEKVEIGIHPPQPSPHSGFWVAGGESFRTRPLCFTPRIQISSEFPGIPAIPLLSSILRRIPFLLYGGIYRKVTEVTERNAKVPLFNLAPTRHFHLTPAQQIQPWPPTTNLTPSRPSKPSVFQHCQLSAVTWEMTTNTLTTAKQSGLMVLLRLYSWRNSFPPKNTVTFLRPDDANVRLLSFNIPRNSLPCSRLGITWQPPRTSASKIFHQRVSFLFLGIPNISHDYLR